MHITSRQNERVKEAAKLRNSRQRAKQGRFLIDGARAITRAVGSDIEIAAAFVCEEMIDTEERRAVVATLEGHAANYSTVTSEVYEKLAFGDNEDGLVAVAVTPQRSLSELELPDNPLIAVLESLEKPGNVGAILRTADGAGVDAVIIADGATDLFNPNTIRASMGTIFAPNVCAASSSDVLALLRERKLPVIATLPEAERLYTEVDYRSGAAIVLGSEATGLSEQWLSADIQGVRLPMRGIADSLNVSATAAVMFYEALRQRGC